MRQAVITSPGNLVFRDIPEIENLKSNEILMRVKRIGVCGSDIHVYHGQHPAVRYPVVQGHEYSAQVVRVGRDVKAIKPGMNVTARPQLVCGQCAPCMRGDYNICLNLRVEGFQAPGVAQEYFVCTEDRVVVLPETVSDEYGALVEPVAVAVHATSRVSLLEGKNVVVAGAGLIGNLLAQMAMVRGADNVLITDISEFRLETARACGIPSTLNVRSESFHEGIQRVFGDEGFQVGFEAAGAEASLSSLMAEIEKGGEIVIVGVYAQNPMVNMFHLGEHELTLRGSLMYKHQDYLKAVELIASGVLTLDPIISKRFSFENYDKAYLHIEKERDKVMKVMITL